ncbi:RdgB/HAM1 family non-canonical purine NTP pyrophosphatase [Paludibaculum fermentans]|uniref:dITP/XTP pyrophosphatase n=1 Tax=Paludibaculum fermentans TaxID=1473598 RepID=A0A7S7SPF1_PALFE|nr:RdgB/HAM1 family non-canonical purine NTP pyrophosphatase [Paludibaculum fermentans]QOY91075.1 RdgB/HAM1 family non-canonical purine NTP pyrophosphatase [Paludibaculum fermentans]
MIIRCATTNSGKVREFHMAAAHFGYPEIDIQLLENMKSVPPAVEDGESFDENAIKKALHYSKHTDDLVFADDSGLEVDALDCAPGVLSARYSPEGTDEANNRLLIENLRDQDDRIARFVCVIALARKGELVGMFKGEVEGIILDEPAGPNGFGYDPHFFYPPFNSTFGEASEEKKMSVSHRGQALKAMLAFISKM